MEIRCEVNFSELTISFAQGRIPGTDRWKPINENPEAEEDVPGVMIIRLREDLYFANTAQLKGEYPLHQLSSARSHPTV